MNHERRVWRKSSYSTPDGQCIEIAETPEGFDLRDSKDPTGPALSFDRSRWAEFIRAIKQEGLVDHKTTSRR